jgi:3,4-dihydroxy 2-butanone 4-phosphate synthase/GTP cyclohydrolase II
MTSYQFIEKSNTCIVDHGEHKWNLFGVNFNHNTSKVIVLCFYYGQISDGALLRINSPCITSETFGDLNRCDCKLQLDKAIEAIEDRGSGIILYNLDEEGKGNGIFSKINSYHLMTSEGLDAIGSYKKLGSQGDLRDYTYVDYFIKHFGLNSVKLISKNRDKIAAVETYAKISEKIDL